MHPRWVFTTLGSIGLDTLGRSHRQEGMEMHSHSIRWLAAAAFAGILVGSLSAAEGALRLHYAFDAGGPGGEARDLGSEPAAPGTYSASAATTGESPALFSCMALDLTANGANQNYVTSTVDVQKIDALPAMTVTFWLNLRADPLVGDCLLSDEPIHSPVPPAGTGGWQLIIGQNGSAPLTAGNFAIRFGLYESFGSYSQAQFSTSPGINAAQKWVFVAVSCDAAHYQRYYLGDVSTSVSQIGGATIFSWGLLDNSSELRIGGASFAPTVDWTPPAWMDDVRIYDTALTLSEIDAVRRANLLYEDLDAVPGFHGLHGFPGGKCGSHAAAVSGNGEYVVGQSRLPSGDSGAFRWSNGTIESLGDLPGGSVSSFATSVSGDGSVVAGYSSSAEGTEAFRWESNAMTPLGDLPGGPFSSAANGVSADGRIVVGGGTYGSGRDEGEALRWQDGVMTGLGYVQTGSNAFGISPDGNVIVGSTGTATGFEACRWVNSVIDPIGELPGGTIGAHAYAASTDGTIIVGASYSTLGWEAYRWTSGVMTPLGDLPGGGFYSAAYAVSGDGTIIVGEGRNELNRSEAFVWTPIQGMRPLKQVLEQDYGLNLSGWWLTAGTDISSDGTTIVGRGYNPSGRTESWIARLPKVNRSADLDGDDDVDMDDIEVFEACATGPGIPYNPLSLPTDCTVDSSPGGILVIDWDADGDIDQADFGGRMQTCFSGDGNTAAPECLE